jgi:DNA-binding transcriptional LysR family regulator
MKQAFTIERDQLDGVLAFLRVAERQSFRAAAAELGISPSAVSQTVRNLEKRVGVALLMRTTRKVGLTEAGRRFFERAQPAVAALTDAFGVAQAFGKSATGLLRLNVPRAAVPYLTELIKDFCEAYPDIQLEIFVEDRLIDLVAEGFDAGIRLEQHVQADMVAVQLSPPFQFAVVGSPDYFERYGRPQRPEDLRAHRCICFRPNAREAVSGWKFREGNRTFDIAVGGPIVVNDWMMNVAAATKGLGLAYSIEPLVEREVAQGRLERVLDAFCPDTSGAFLYYPSRVQALPKLRAFIAFARERLKSHPRRRA